MRTRPSCPPDGVVHGAIVEAARDQADRGLAGSMQGHAAMDMSVRTDAPLWRRLRSPAGFTATARQPAGAGGHVAATGQTLTVTSTCAYYV